MQRRYLLNRLDAFYLQYPNTCIFLVEEVYADIVGTNFRFGSSRTDIFIHYTDKNGKPVTEHTPVREVSGWPIPGSNSGYRPLAGSEFALFRFYGHPRLIIKKLK